MLQYLFIQIQPSVLHFREKWKTLIEILGKLIKTWDFQVEKTKWFSSVCFLFLKLPFCPASIKEKQILVISLRVAAGEVQGHEKRRQKHTEQHNTYTQESSTQ